MSSVVFDNGASTLKVGRGTDEDPIVIPNSIVRYRLATIMAS